MIAAAEAQARHEYCQAAIMASSLRGVADVLKKDTTNPKAPSLARGAVYTADEMLQERCCSGCTLLEGRDPYKGYKS